MRRRTKAALVAGLMALGLIVGERIASADDLWLRIVCAPYTKADAMWWILGCYALPDDNHPPEG